MRLGQNEFMTTKNNLGRMTRNSKLIWGVYLIAFTLTILSGLAFGFTDSHTPPMPFVLGTIFILLGLNWTLTDLIILIVRKTGTIKMFLAQLGGLAINGLFIFYLLTTGTNAHWP
jgi:predicted transporter